MGMQDRDWYREEKRQARNGGATAAKPEPVRRARPVFFVHLLAGFWSGLFLGVLAGVALGVLIAGFA
jgi:predicted lipid-binding transport protein (Tim44 family)